MKDEQTVNLKRKHSFILKVDAVCGMSAIAATLAAKTGDHTQAIVLCLLLLAAGLVRLYLSRTSYISISSRDLRVQTALGRYRSLAWDELAGFEARERRVILRDAAGGILTLFLDQLEPDDRRFLLSALAARSW
ncbi:MAG: hypothetical protein ACYC55_00240 [Candidatus Geothermincolia bacterium]